MKISSCKKIDLGKFYALYFNILNKVIIVYHIVNYTGLPTNDETSETTLKIQTVNLLILRILCNCKLVSMPINRR